MNHPDLKHSPIRAVNVDRDEDDAAQGSTQKDGLAQNQEIPGERYDQLSNALVRPSRCWSPRELLADFDNVPRSRGTYGWFFRSLPPGVPSEGTCSGPFGVLLYVGIAPNGPISKRTLRDRIRDHLKGPIASSTLRRSLAGLLAKDLGLEIIRNTQGRLQLSPGQEAILTEWMCDEARIAWAVCDQPWELERRLLAQGPRLPLNIRGSQNGYANELRRVRSLAANLAP